MRLLCVEVSGVENVQYFWYFAACVERAEEAKGLAPLLNSWCIYIDLAGLFSTRHAMIAYSTAEELLAGRTDVAESGGPLKHVLSTYVDEEKDKLAKEKASLRSSLTKISM